MSDLEARIAEVLAAHDHKHTRLDGDSAYRQSCSCGHFEIRGGSTGLPVRMSYEWIRTHQAAMLAPVIREAQADAWGDGALAAYQSLVHGDTSTNPYRSNDE